MSQQRTSGRRRVAPNMLGVQFGTFDWIASSWAGTTMLLDLYPNYPSAPLSLDGFTLNGVPQMFENNTNQTASAAAIVGSQLELTFPNPLDVGIVLYLPESDLAFRDPFGAFMRAGVYISAGAPPVPQNAVALGALDDAGRAEISQDGGAGLLYVRGVPLIANTTTSEFADAVMTQGSNVYATFPTGVSSGDQIDYIANTDDFLGVSGGYLESFSLTIP